MEKILFFLSMFTADSETPDYSSQELIKPKKELYTLNQYLSPKDQETFKQLQLPELSSSKKKVKLSVVAQNFVGISSKFDELIKLKQQETIQNGLQALEKNEFFEPFEQFQKAVETALFNLLTTDDNREPAYKPLLPTFKEKINKHYKGLFLQQKKEKKNEQNIVIPVNPKNNFLELSTNTYFSHVITAFCSGSIIGILVFLSQKLTT
jgi:hypothetical protein